MMALRRATLRVRGVFDPEVPRRALALGNATPSRNTPARGRVLKLMQDGLARSVPGIAEEANVGPGVVKGLADAVNITDGAGARPHLGAVTAAAILVEQGIEPVLQLTCRDRNRIALRREVAATQREAG